MSGDLPTGWASAPVGELFSSHGGGTPSRGIAGYWNGNILWLSSGDIKAATISESSEKITKRGLQESTARLCRPGSVLVVVRSGILKHTLPVAILRREASINQDIKAFDCGDDRLNRWLALAWRASARDLLSENREGTTVQSVKMDTLCSFDLHVPPLAEQKRIVAKVEKLLAKVDASRARLDKTSEILKRFRQSVLVAACSGRLTADWRNEKSSLPIVPPVNIGMPENTSCVSSWAWKKLSKLARLESGHTPRKTILEYWQNGDVPWICLQDIRAANGKAITDTVLCPTMKGIDNSSARMLPAGTVVFSRDISVGYVTIMGRDMATSQHFANWICGPNLNNRFLMYALMASRHHLMSSQQGSTVGTIYMPALEEFHMLKPPLPEQREIVRRVEELFALADRLEARVGKTRGQVEKLTQSILAKAFRGELVPQNPNDEPAEKLLARIRAKNERITAKGDKATALASVRPGRPRKSR